MTDIVKRLRRCADKERPYGPVSDICDEAAAEIERLRAALEQIADTDPDEGTQWFHEVARAALAQGGE